MHDASAAGAARDLHDRYGFTRLLVLQGGLGAWEAAHLPTDAGVHLPATSPGERLFRRDCMVCHQPDGSGVPGHIPPLAGDPLLQAGDTAAIAHVITHGLAGRAIAGKPYDQRMPAFAGHLTAADRATLIAYLRDRWGPHAARRAPLAWPGASGSAPPKASEPAQPKASDPARAGAPEPPRSAASPRPTGSARPLR